MPRWAWGAGLSGFEVPLFDQRQLDLLQEALDALGEEDSTLRARILARLSVAASFVRTADQRSELSREAIDIARRIGDREALAYALSSSCDATAGPAHTEERVTLATEMVEIGQETANREMELLGGASGWSRCSSWGTRPRWMRRSKAFARVADALRVPLYRWYVALWRGDARGHGGTATRLRATAGMGRSDRRTGKQPQMRPCSPMPSATCG